MAPFYFWIVLALLCAALEMGHPGLFFFLSFSSGAIGAGVLSLAYPSAFMLQAITFLAATIASFVLLRRVADRHVDHQQTNVQALIGKHGTVIELVSAQVPGQVRIAGEMWLARTTQKEDIKQGQKVVVIAVRGAHVVVEAVVD